MHIVSFGAQTYRLKPAASTLASWGALGRSRSTWEHKRGDLGVQAWIFIDFGLISGVHFESFTVPLDQNNIFVRACFQVIFLIDFGF